MNMTYNKVAHLRNVKRMHEVAIAFYVREIPKLTGKTKAKAERDLSDARKLLSQCVTD